MKKVLLFLFVLAAVAACKHTEDAPPVTGSWKLIQVRKDAGWKPYPVNHILTLTSGGAATNTGAADSLGIGSAYQKYVMNESSRITFRPANESMSNLLSVTYVLSGDTLTFQAMGFARGQRYLRQK